MASQIPPGSLSRAKSALTTMLAMDPDKSDFHEIFSAVPRKPGETPESIPVAVLSVPRGRDFCITAGVSILLILVGGYLLSIGVGVIIAFVNMAVDSSCGQDTWYPNAAAEETQRACNALLKHSFTVGFDGRCFAEKPLWMEQAAFDEVCGLRAFLGPAIGLFLVSLFVLNMVYQTVGKSIPSKVSFHPTLFAVESWHGKFFQCSFYADVTSAKVTSMGGLLITSKAKITLNAGGAADDDKAYGKLLKVTGESQISVIAGDGAAKDKFLAEFAKYLPVRIEGYNNVVEMVGGAQIKRDSSFLHGKLKQLLRARGGDEGDRTEFDAVRKPLSCDLTGDIIESFFTFAFIWHLVGLIPSIIGWTITKGLGKCLDPLKPEEDMCALGRAFVPWSVPNVNPPDWITPFCFTFGQIAFFLYQFLKMPAETRFHNNGIVQEVLFAGWSWLDSKMVFAEDVKTLETVNGCFEKYVKMKVKASYVIKEGLGKPFEIQAVFVNHKVKLELVDKDCASCSGHGAMAASHREKLVELAEKFKAGVLKKDEEVGESSAAKEPAGSESPAQESMPEACLAVRSEK